MFEVILAPEAGVFYNEAGRPLARKLARCFAQLERDPHRCNNIQSIMEEGIKFKKVWSDDDCAEINVAASDGSSVFLTKVYVGHPRLADLVGGLDRFKGQIHGGVYDLRLGEFGPEYASGAFHARLHFHQPGHGRIFITVHAESDWHDFTVSKVASSATLYLTTEPALFDNFVAELGRLKAGETNEAFLSCR